MKTISREEAWDGEHLSDIAVTLLADGEATLAGDGALAHAESCEACAQRVGEAAVLSSRIEAGLRVVPLAAPSAVHRFPVWMVAAAVVLAGVGFVPSARATARDIISVSSSLPSSASALDSAVVLASDISHSRLFAVATFVAAAVLIALGFFIALSSTRRGARAPRHSESS